MNNSKEDITRELEAIKRAVGSLEGGGNIDEIQVVLNAPIKLRTLQRRLKTLIGQGGIITTGKGKSIKPRLCSRAIRLDLMAVLPH